MRGCTGTGAALAVLLLIGGCSSGEGTDPGSSAVPSPPTSATATTTTIDPTSSFMPGPPLAAGIWLAEFGPAILQFRLDAGPDDVITGVFDSPAEGVTDLPVTVTTDGDAVQIIIPAASAVFEGTADEDSLTGIWTQAGNELPLVFERQAEPFAFARPQEPVPPYPYNATDVRFHNDDITLAGTLITPDGTGPFPTAVLISGSGGQDRDETLMGHKPFLVLADALARAGIATLRFDDRGVAESTGTPVGATTADLATDTLAAVEYLRSQPQIGVIGLIGHSEGGLIAPMVAAESPDVSFIVLLAGPGLAGAEVLGTQTEDLLRAEGMSEDGIAWRMRWNDTIIELAASEAATPEVAEQIRTLLTEAAADAPALYAGQVSAELIEQMTEAFTDPWMRYFLAYDPEPALARLDVPVLAMIGTLDLQVSAAANVPALQTALAPNPDATVRELPGLNHLFQTATTGAVSEYGLIEETMSPAVPELISGWILQRFNDV
jgi:pimeloyl-ACP methyl ester carboxylesterase